MTCQNRSGLAFRPIQTHFWHAVACLHGIESQLDKYIVLIKIKMSTWQMWQNLMIPSSPAHPFVISPCLNCPMNPAPTFIYYLFLYLLFIHLFIIIYFLSINLSSIIYLFIYFLFCFNVIDNGESPIIMYLWHMQSSYFNFNRHILLWLTTQ